MNVWRKPIIIEYDAIALATEIKAKAWSVESAMSIGSFLDQGNQGASGTVYMEPENMGYTIQVEVIGSIFVAGYYIKTLIDQYGRIYKYKGTPGNWVRYYD